MTETTAKRILLLALILLTVALISTWVMCWQLMKANRELDQQYQELRELNKQIYQDVGRKMREQEGSRL